LKGLFTDYDATISPSFNEGMWPNIILHIKCDYIQSKQTKKRIHVGTPYVSSHNVPQ